MDPTINQTATLFEKWAHAAIEFAPKILLATGVLVIFYFAAKLVQKVSYKFYARAFKNQDRLANLISIFIYVCFLASGLFIALEILGLESVLAKILTGAGVFGIVIGFAVKDITANSFAGLLLNAHRPFSVGDLVEIDGVFGTVEKIDPITTSIKTLDGEQVFIPNQIIYTDKFTNFSEYGKRRLSLKTGVAYGDDLEKVRTVTLDEIKKINAVLPNEKVDFYFTEISASAYNFEVRFWIKFTHQPDYLAAMSEAIMRIHDRFDKEGFSIAYNVTTLDFDVKGGKNIFDDTIKLEKL